MRTPPCHVRSDRVRHRRFAGDQRKAKTHTVTIEGMRFQPEVLTVARGDTIVWVNKDLVPSHRDVKGRQTSIRS